MIKKLKDKKINRYLNIIDKIENTRSTNNINWMNILRVAIVNSPDETIKIIKKINFNNHKISSLLKKLEK